jgi:membrane-bound lytic murein transglycosylase D
MIESGYSTYAYSHAHAAGLWQFIPSTGKMYDLRIDWWVDERRDPVKATRSALRYLRDLHAMFDDWLLAFAAYNGGPGRIRRALNEAGEGADFWTLQEGPYLHPETDNYVPRIIAAAIIAKHPERYGFRGLVKDRPLRHDTVTVDGSVEMEILAECAGLSVDDFRALNPALRRGATPQGRFAVHVPVGRAQAFLTALDGVPSSRRRTYSSHRVASGETLGSIASHYGTDLEELVQANGLDDANRIYVGMTVLVPSSGGEKAKAPAAPASADAKPVASKPSASATPSPPESSTSYVVKSGDTLGEIAERYGVSTTQLRSWNGMRSTRIYPGQKIEIRGVDSATTKIYYMVERGDSLSQIATRYGVPMSSIQSWNNLSDSSHIYAGQELVLHLDDARWRVYLVKAGDNLGAIARSNDCSVEELQTWNDLGSSQIFPGQKLRIKR